MNPCLGLPRGRTLRTVALAASLALAAGCATPKPGGENQAAALPAGCADLSAEANPAAANRAGTVIVGVIAGAILGAALGALTGDERVMAGMMAAGAAVGGGSGLAVANANERAAANQASLRQCNQAVQASVETYRLQADTYQADARRLRGELARAQTQLRRGRITEAEYQSKVEEAQALVAQARALGDQAAQQAGAIRNVAPQYRQLGDTRPQVNGADRLDRESERLRATADQVGQLLERRWRPGQ